MCEIEAVEAGLGIAETERVAGEGMTGSGWDVTIILGGWVDICELWDDPSFVANRMDAGELDEEEVLSIGRGVSVG